jgi:ABC-2 type transport system ATP-binding protein
VTPPPLEIAEVSHAYGPRPALRGVSFAVRPGSFTALLGPNGAGKTTLFGLVTGLLGLQAGRVAICGIEPTRAGAAALAPLGLVFQQPTLDLDLTVAQNLAYFASLRGLSRREGRRRAEAELERLEMAERAHERVRALNGGHRRRVELARALLHGPRLLLLDEPTVGLDVESRRRIVGRVHALAREDGVGVLWATHLIDEIESEDDLAVLAAGRVVAAGRAAEIVSAADARDLPEAFGRLTRAARAA